MPAKAGTQPPRVCAANEPYARLDGPLLRAMTPYKACRIVERPDIETISARRITILSRGHGRDRRRVRGNSHRKHAPTVAWLLHDDIASHQLGELETEGKRDPDATILARRSTAVVGKDIEQCFSFDDIP